MDISVKAFYLISSTFSMWDWKWGRLLVYVLSFALVVLPATPVRLELRCRCLGDCHSLPSYLLFSLPYCFIPLWEMSLTIHQQLLALCLCLLCMHRVSQYFTAVHAGTQHSVLVMTSFLSKITPRELSWWKKSVSLCCLGKVAYASVCVTVSIWKHLTF